MLQMVGRQDEDILVVENDIRGPDSIDRNAHMIHATEHLLVPAK